MTDAWANRLFALFLLGLWLAPAVAALWQWHWAPLLLYFPLALIFGL